MNWMLRNSAGKPDGMFTFATIGFFVTTFCIVCSVIKSVTIGGFTIKIHVDESLLLGYLASTYSAYVLRRKSRDKLDLHQKQQGALNGDL